MSYDLTAFTDYIGRELQAITATLYAGGDTAKFAMFMSGIKGSTEIPDITGDATLQGGTCVSPSGTTKVGLPKITVEPFTYFEGFCNDDLQTKFPAMALAPGSNNEGDAPNGWQATVIDVKTASINKQLELTYWQGNTESGSYQRFNGFIKQIDADGNAVAGNKSNATSFTTANAITVIDDMVDSAAPDVKKAADFAVLVGDDYWDTYMTAIREKNYNHYKPEADAEGVFTIPGKNKKLIRIYGLNGTGRIFAGRGYHFVVGNDVEAEISDSSEKIEVFYDKTDDKVYMRAKGKAGVKPIHVEEIVQFTLVS